MVFFALTLRLIWGGAASLVSQFFCMLRRVTLVRSYIGKPQQLSSSRSLFTNYLYHVTCNTCVFAPTTPNHLVFWRFFSGQDVELRHRRVRAYFRGGPLCHWSSAVHRQGTEWRPYLLGRGDSFCAVYRWRCRGTRYLAVLLLPHIYSVTNYVF